MFQSNTVWPVLNFFIFFIVGITFYGFGYFGLSRLAYRWFISKDIDKDHYFSLSVRGFWVGLVTQIIVSFLINHIFRFIYFSDNLCGEFPPRNAAQIQASWIAFFVIIFVYTLTTFLSLYTLALPSFIPNRLKRLYYTLLTTIPLGSSFYLVTFLMYSFFMRVL